MKKFATMILGATIFFTGLGAIVKQAGEIMRNNLPRVSETSKAVEEPAIIRSKLFEDLNEKPAILLIKSEEFSIPRGRNLLIIRKAID